MIPTKNAILQFKRLTAGTGNLMAGIRFYTIPTCCSSLLKMEVVSYPDSLDVAVEIDGVNFYITPDAEQLLSGITIDFIDVKFKSVQQEQT